MVTRRQHYPGPPWSRSAAAVAGVVAYAVQREPDGAASPESAVAGYLSALKANDRGQLSNLADPDYQGSDEITNRLQRFGGGKLVISNTESDVTDSVDLTGTLDGAPYTEKLWLNGRQVRWHGDQARWFVALGPNRNAHSK